MTDKGMERLRDELRRWAQRPTSLSPRAARTRVVARLASPRRRPAWRLVSATTALAASALALTLVVGALVIGRQAEPVAGPPPTTAAAQRMIVHQLSSGTKLYIVVQPHTRGDES
jgi:hypothetical protein